MDALQKITEAQMDANGVCSAPNVLNGTVAQNKAVFDKMVRQLVAPAYNAAVDAIGEINATETGIQAEEALRVTAESGRVSAENGRVSAENERSSSEALRDSAESARISAETARSAAESSRVNAENGRAGTELERVNAETARAAAEVARAATEVARVGAEAQRAAAESARNVWESFNAARAYTAGNKVSYQGSSYVCVQAGAGNLPTNTAFWTLIAAKGIDGEGAGDMLAATYDPTGKARDIFAYADQQASGSAAAVQASLNNHAASDIVHLMAGDRARWNAKANTTTLTAHTGRTDNPHGVTAAQIGAARIATGSYTGTGIFGPANLNSLTFGFVPKIVIIYRVNLPLRAEMVDRLMWYSGLTGVISSGGQSQNGTSTNDTVTFTQSGTTLSWYGSSQFGYTGKSQCNELNVIYNYIAIG
ncbi:hypothetical protein [uncultured Oscillibacter sp.]|uniref:hypothetical protein n=1 Tax=uncultured Oscillibacter sp. TaxID=876091 RepID=UPI0025D9F0C3|nr:hypothetical protein [uncultured Oscillibacter sp.]